MPLHDWSDDTSWSAVHLYWITEIARWLKPRLPEGYRAFIGSAPALAVEVPGNPDVGVINGPPRTERPSTAHGAGAETGEEYLRAEEELVVGVATSDKEPYVFVERKGWMIAAVEL